MQKYKDLQQMFDDYLKDILREFAIKEQIATTFMDEKERLIDEISMAKQILGEP